MIGKFKENNLYLDDDIHLKGEETNKNPNHNKKDELEKQEHFY